MLTWGVGELFPDVRRTLPLSSLPSTIMKAGGRLTSRGSRAQVARSPVYLSMITAWSFAEIIRYSHYVAGLAGVKVQALEWLRCVSSLSLYDALAERVLTLLVAATRLSTSCTRSAPAPRRSSSSSRPLPPRRRTVRSPAPGPTLSSALGPRVRPSSSSRPSPTGAASPLPDSPPRPSQASPS